MMKWSLLAAGILGCTTPAHAQFGTPNSFNVDLQVSTDNVTTWGNRAVVSDAGSALMMRKLFRRTALHASIRDVAACAGVPAAPAWLSAHPLVVTPKSPKCAKITSRPASRCVFCNPFRTPRSILLNRLFPPRP